MAQPAKQLNADGQPKRVCKTKETAFNQLMKSSAKVESSKPAKKKVPILDTPDDIKVIVDAYIKAKSEENKAKAEKENLGDTLIEFVRPIQDKDGFNGNHRHSYAIQGTENNKATYISKNQFSINAEDLGEIQDILGEYFDQLMEQKFIVTLKEEVFEDPALQNELMEMMGDKFEEFFDTVTKLRVKERFDEKIYDYMDENSLGDIRVFVRPYRASLR